MNQKTLTKLEYDKIILMLEEQASSFRGKQLCRRLKPMTDPARIEAAQEQTAAAFTRIIRKGRISFGDAAPGGRIYEAAGDRRRTRRRGIAAHSAGCSVRRPV
jgi:DNA mismatch repair protein MutS2